MVDRPDLDRLKAILLAKGGSRFQVDDFLEKELEPAEAELLALAGREDPIRDADVRSMDVSECHANVRELVRTEQGLEWHFGLALSADGIWRIHSWAWGSGRILETTLLRDCYFGINMGYLIGLRDGVVEAPDPSDPYVAAANRLGPRRPGQRGASGGLLSWLRRLVR
jgi:hypothetical protein